MARRRTCIRCKEAIMEQQEDDPDVYICPNCGKEAIDYGDFFEFLKDEYEHAQAFWKNFKTKQPDTTDEGEGW